MTSKEGVEALLALAAKSKAKKKKATKKGFGVSKKGFGAPSHVAAAPVACNPAWDAFTAWLDESGGSSSSSSSRLAMLPHVARPAHSTPRTDAHTADRNANIKACTHMCTHVEEQLLRYSDFLGRV